MKKSNSFYFICLITACLNVFAQEAAPAIENGPAGDNGTSSSIEGITVPADGINSQVIGGVSDVYDPPPPTEKAVWGGKWNESTRIVLHRSSFAGIALGLAITVGGIGILFSGAGDGLDRDGMHQGLLVAVSGTLITTLCAILFDATGVKSSEPTLPE